MPEMPRKLPFGTSLARQVAKQNLTGFNNVFWVSERAHAHLKSSYSSITFPRAGPGVHGLFADAATWESASDEFRDWTRRHVLISAASLLEIYIASISKTALQANPELLDRSLVGVDGGAFLVKETLQPNGWKKLVNSTTERFTKGLWKNRFRQMEIVLGKLPAALTMLEPDLQKIQNKRNKIAHEYGSETPRSVPWDAISPVSVSAKDCESAIRTVSTFIAEADNAVFSKFVGAYEVLILYHGWVKREKNLLHHTVMGTKSAAFRDYIGRVSGHALGKEYAQAVIDYYDSF